MRRRALIAGVSGVALAAPLAARAQQAAKPARIGFLIAGDAEPTWGLFRKSMTELGYVEGRNVHYEFRTGPAPAMRTFGLFGILTLPGRSLSDAGA